MKVIANWLQQGFIRSHVSKVFAFDEIAEAHKQIETGKTRGKIVVQVK
jgi:NADPH:quinone reductase-like Zn-dependent oxidoreductase